MAEISDVPEDLRKWARVIMPSTLALMDPLELRVRLEYVAQLVGLTDLSDESEAKRLRRTARRHLEAISLRQLIDAQSDLRERISEAIRDGDDRQVAYLGDQLEALPGNNPQVSEDYTRDVELAQLVRLAAKRKSQPAAWKPQRLSFRRKLCTTAIHFRAILCPVATTGSPTR